MTRSESSLKAGKGRGAHRRWAGLESRAPQLTLTALGFLGWTLASLGAAELPRTAVEVVRPRTQAVLLRIDAELAMTPDTRAYGLMERGSLPADRGMLFIFEAAQPLSFWMLNTLIPLDMLFVDAARRIVSISASVPPCRPPLRCPTYTSRGPAQFVLEVNAGTAAKHGIEVGDELRWQLP